MTIPQRILLHVAVAAGLVIAVATAVTYGIVFNGAKQRDLKHLETYVRERTRREETGFKQVEVNLALVRGQFLKRRESPIPRNYDAQWNDRFELFPDGAWRSRKQFADGRKYSTLWAHKNVTFTPELKTEVLRAQNICDELLPGWADEFPSVYFVLPGWLNWFTASIGYHHIHHLSASIPNYRLAECHAENQQLFSAVTRVRLSEIPKALSYILWDTRARRIISVAEFESQASA